MRGMFLASDYLFEGKTPVILRLGEVLREVRVVSILLSEVTFID